MSTPWSLAADLLESGELGEPNRWWRRMGEAAERLRCEDCAARMMSYRTEAFPYPAPDVATRQVVALLPGLQPQWWAAAPRGRS